MYEYDDAVAVVGVIFGGSIITFTLKKILEILAILKKLVLSPLSLNFWGCSDAVTLLAICLLRQLVHSVFRIFSFILILSVYE